MINIVQSEILNAAWQEYLLYRNMSLDVYDSAVVLYNSSRNDKNTEVVKLEAFKLYDEGDKLYKISLDLWKDAVYKIYGEINITWEYKYGGYCAILPDNIYKFERW